MSKNTHQTNKKNKAREARFLLENMRCASCIKIIEKTLHALPTVESVRVNFANKEVTLYGTFTTKQIQTALQKAGYVARLAEDQQIQEAKLATRQYYQLLGKSGLALVVGIVLIINLFIPWLPALTQQIQWSWVGVCLVTLCILIFSGSSIYRSAFSALVHKRVNMNTLVALGTGTAWLYSAIVVLFARWIPPMAQIVYFDTAVILIAFITLGNALEQKATGSATQAIRELIALSPKTAIRISATNEEQSVPIEELVVGDLIRVRPGEAIAVDGLVESGQSQVDESMLTGEARLVPKSKNAEVAAGTINQSGSLLFRATRVGKDTALARIIDLVKRAQESKPEIGKLADQVSAVFVPVVLVIALVTAILWWICGPIPKAGFVLVTTIAVLVIACPCALGLATPISIMVGVGQAAKQGVLIQQGDALQVCTSLQAIVFDKTGTITEGKSKVTTVVPIDSTIDEHTLLQYAASVEIHSEHPVAAAIVLAAKEKQISLLPTENFHAVTGKGVCANLQDKQMILGNLRYFSELGFPTESLQQEIKRQKINGATIVVVGMNQRVLGILVIADPIRKDAAAVIAKLKQLGLRVLMLTGDTEQVAQDIAARTGIDEFIAGVLPAEKAVQVQRLQAKGFKVGMVGDGINDAPALAQADVGFAMASGTDIAIKSADVILLRGSLAHVVSAIAVSRATMRNIKQNLWGAFLYNTLAIPIAAGVFYPLMGTLLSPMVAGAAMALSSLTVVLNANRLRWVRRYHL